MRVGRRMTWRHSGGSNVGNVVALAAVILNQPSFAVVNAISRIR
jgi:hypothetical protein